MAIEDHQDIGKLQRQIRTLMRKLEDERHGRVSLERAIEEAAIAAFSTLDIPKIPKPTGISSKKGSEEYAVICAADWQSGKVTPNYDSDVMLERINLYGEKIVKLTNIQRADHNVKKARLWFLGDIVEGEDIFPGQAYHIDASLFDQLFGRTLEAGIKLINTLLANFEEVHVTGVIGNHGRIGRKGVYDPNTNADRIFYNLLRIWFRDEERVTWTIPTAARGDRGWYAVEKIGNYSCLLLHGDQFRGGGSFAGLPFYSFAKGVYAWSDMSKMDEMPAFDDVACGHWHVNVRIPFGSSNLRVVGSPESYNPWSIETLKRTAPPTQHLMFVEPERGIVTAEYVVPLG